jgi:hypothetical protein
MTAYEKGFRRALEGIVDPQLYALMMGYRNGHMAATVQMTSYLNRDTERGQTDVHS